MASPVQYNPGENTDVIDFDKSRAGIKQRDQVITWTLDQFRQCKQARAINECQWYLNIAFYLGQQYVTPLTYNSPNIGFSTTRLVIPPAPPWRSRPVINRIRPIIRTELAQLTNNKPNATVVPASAEDRDMYAAMAGEQIWDNQYTEKRLKAIIRRAMWWTLVTGTGYIKSYWDTDKKDIIYLHETPFHILVPDLTEEDIENQPYVIHAQLKSPEYLQMHYPKANMNVDSKSMSSSDLLEESFTNLIGVNSPDKKKTVMALEVHVRPGCHPLFPDGAFYTLINNQIVYAQSGMAFDHGKYPFAKFDHIPTGKFYSASVIEDLIPIQKEFNRTRGQIIEAKNKTAKPQLLAAAGSIQPSKITTEPGQVIEYKLGFPKPEPLQLQTLPNYVIQEVDRMLIDINDISGQHEVTHGQIPPGVTAATAISFLQERDESKLSSTFDSLEEGIEKIAQMTLWYVHKFWTTERTIKVTGPDGSFDALVFQGSDLRDNLDIRIEAGSALPVSKAARQAFIMDLMRMGFIDPNKGLEVMDMGGINKIYEQIQVDNRQAQREDMRMSKVTPDMLMQYNAANQRDPTQFGTDEVTGAPLEPPLIVPVNTWDNHRVHIETHNNYRKGQAFEMLPQENKILFEKHVQQHIMALGIESQTMNPQAAAGVPPVESEGEPGTEQMTAKPGPEPIPEMETV